MKVSMSLLVVLMLSREPPTVFLPSKKPGPIRVKVDQKHAKNSLVTLLVALSRPDSPAKVIFLFKIAFTLRQDQQTNGYILRHGTQRK